jgi:aspartyl-tRNA(Asn)/glutamyl-tRNA(Gln) amidotransferase subunit A
VAFGSSLDQIGSIARTVAGAAAVLGGMAGADPLDSTCSALPVPEWSDDLVGDVAGMRVGVLRDLLGEGVDADVRAATEAALEKLAGAGAELVDVSLPHAKYGVAAYYVVSSAEASSNLARFDGARYGVRADGVSDLESLYVESRSAGLGPEVQRRILIGTFALSAGYHDAYYGRATRARGLIRADYEAAFARADVLASPVAPTAAFALGERTEDPLAMYLVDAMTIPPSLAGVPALSVPAGATAAGLPVGLQLTAPHFQEGRLFRAAAAVEREVGPAALPAALAGESA